MDIAARLNDIPKPAWIALMVLGFIVWWPLGLAILAYLLWSGRMSCWKHHAGGRWHDERKERMHDRASRWWHGERGAPTSGNRAFDEYRQETLRRLEDEQKEFKDFLDRLRHAKDKAEFDEFVAAQRRAKDNPPPPSGSVPPSGGEPPRNDPR